MSDEHMAAIAAFGEAHDALAKALDNVESCQQEVRRLGDEYNRALDRLAEVRRELVEACKASVSASQVVNQTERTVQQ